MVKHKSIDEGRLSHFYCGNCPCRDPETEVQRLIRFGSTPQLIKRTCNEVENVATTRAPSTNVDP